MKPAVIFAALALASSAIINPLVVSGDEGRADSTPGASLRTEIGTAAASLGIEEANDALLAASHDDALPDGYVPPGLTSLAAAGIPQRGSWQLRSILLPDLSELVAAASQDGIRLWVASGYRSYATQVYTYNTWVARFGQESADQRSARPGHSQHQLGTTIDFNLGAGFLGSPEGAWLWQHAHEFGFVFPYTPASRSRTGYIFEPWHVRWVGRPLAEVMWRAGYLDSAEMTADDYVALARSLVLGQESA